MRMTWYGHSAFRVEAGNVVALIDPFLSGNPKWDGGWKEVAEGITHLLLTHGHNDHFGDTLEIARASGAQVVCVAEIAGHLSREGVGTATINQGNTGGTVDCGGFTTTFVNALHSSSLSGEDGAIYMGHPNGLVLKFDGDRTLYHMGDTDIFGDMALINELHAPDFGIVPIGDRFTMGGAVAALACRRFFDFSAVIPCHFGTFPILDQDTGKFLAGMGDQADRVVAARIGEPFEL